MTVNMEKHYYDLSHGPKTVSFYATDHALNSEARSDRYEWLREQLRLPELPAGVLASVPQTR